MDPSVEGKIFARRGFREAAELYFGERFLFANSRFRDGGPPQIHRGICAPRSPCLRAALQLLGIAQVHGTKKAKVSRRERIGLAQRSQTHILSRPLANAGNCTQLLHESLRIDNSSETDLAITHGA